MNDLSALTSEHRYVCEVVRVGYAVRTAKTYLKRHLGNPVVVRLVELNRGEEIGRIRCAEIQSVDGGPVVFIRTRRILPDGSEASFFTPPDLVQIQTVVETREGGVVPPLRSADTIVLEVPVRSYLRYLPGIYRGGSPMAARRISQIESKGQFPQLTDQSSDLRFDQEQSDTFRRFLFLFQHIMTTVIDKIDQIPDITNPMEIEAKSLPWLASWVNFHLDAGLPLQQQRELVRRAIRLQRMRGTVEGVAEMVRILTATPVKILERKKPYGCVLGKMTLAGGKSVDRRYLRREPTPSFVVAPRRKPIGFFVIQLEPQSDFRARFGGRAAGILRRICQIVTREMPAHVVFTIEFADPVEE